MDLKNYIRIVPDWPKTGILFLDITPLLADHHALIAAVEALSDGFIDTGVQYVAAVEARGFVLGAAIAARLCAGFVPIRKKGKLPFKTESITYDLEYGTDTLEIHKDAFPQGAKVLLVDDLLATGGTMNAACQLVKKVGGQIVGISFLIELKALDGRKKIPHQNINSVIPY
jgi:adenine phosphoribosyltransferase